MSWLHHEIPLHAGETSLIWRGKKDIKLYTHVAMYCFLISHEVEKCEKHSFQSNVVNDCDKLDPICYGIGFSYSFQPWFAVVVSMSISKSHYELTHIFMATIFSFCVHLYSLSLYPTFLSNVYIPFLLCMNDARNGCRRKMQSIQFNRAHTHTQHTHFWNISIKI